MSDPKETGGEIVKQNFLYQNIFSGIRTYKYIKYLNREKICMNFIPSDLHCVCVAESQITENECKIRNMFSRYFFCQIT